MHTRRAPAGCVCAAATHGYCKRGPAHTRPGRGGGGYRDGGPHSDAPAAWHSVALWVAVTVAQDNTPSSSHHVTDVHELSVSSEIRSVIYCLLRRFATCAGPKPLPKPCMVYRDTPSHRHRVVSRRDACCSSVSNRISPYCCKPQTTLMHQTRNLHPPQCCAPAHQRDAMSKSKAV